MTAQPSLDCRELRFGGPPAWKYDITDENHHRRVNHQSVLVSDETDHRLIVMGGRRFVGPNTLNNRWYRDDKSVQFLTLSSQRQEEPPIWTSLPDMNEARLSFSSWCFGNKLYVMGGLSAGNFVHTLEILDLDNIDAGWTLNPLPFILNTLNPWHCNAVAVSTHCIFAAFSVDGGKIVYCSYDAQTDEWNLNLNEGSDQRRCAISMASITVPGEGSYVVTLDGSRQSAEAYHVESDAWYAIGRAAFHSDRVSCCGNVRY